MQVDIDMEISHHLREGETIQERTQLRNRAFVVTNRRLIITDPDGMGKPTINLKHQQVEGIKTTHETEKHRLAWAGAAGVGGLGLMLIGFLFLDLGLIGQFQSISDLVTSVAGGSGGFVGVITFFVELITWGGLIAGAVLLAVMAWILLTYRRSRSDYLVIERRDRAPLKLSGSRENVEEVRDVLAQQYRQLKSGEKDTPVEVESEK